MSWVPEVPLSAPAITIRESAFSNVPEHPTQHKSRVDSHNRNKERFSKVSTGKGIPETQERDRESQQNSFYVQKLRKRFESRAMSNVPEHPTQHKSRVDSCNRNEERFSKLSTGKGIPETQERDPESQQNSCGVQKLEKKLEPLALTRQPEKPPRKESRVDSHKSVQAEFSKQYQGNADPGILERDSETQIQSQGIQDLKTMFESPALSHVPEKSSQKESSVDSQKGAQASSSKPSKGNADPVILERGRTVEMSTSVTLESMREEMEKILSEKLAALQRQLEMTQQVIPPTKELTNTSTTLQKISENMQALQKRLENMHVSTKEDLQKLRADLEERVSKAWNAPKRSESEESLLEVENHAGRTVEMSTSVTLESMREEMEKILSEKLAVLQRQLEMIQQVIPPTKELTNTSTTLQKIPENMEALQKRLENTHVSTKEDLQMLRADLEERVPKAQNAPKRSESEERLLDVENHAGFFKMQRNKVDVTLNADTAHPRLEVSEDGKSVNDTGVIGQVPSKDERFDSHIFVLAKEGYTSGRRYWEVDVGKRRNWILGVASESVARKGTVILSPENGFWVISLADGEEYWAHTDPWTRLTVSGKPQKIGIFLDISANKLSFYNAKKKTPLYVFTSIGDSRQKRKFVPFFSTGSGVSVLDTEPLKIVQEFDDDD